ncbi:sel1 repeat family protein [Motiliproteus sp. SC1-56]|uniref:sel1 repeat family protein n=1 Tax=Motiliproteus sp. SC1-56 TaxID=2799565 RepID=UPI001A8FC4A9|nr:sel1 repeat family protein [Motiliproteus sp. SC1-56]
MRNAITSLWLGLVLALGSPLGFGQTPDSLSETDMALGYYKPLAEQGGAYAQLTIGEIYMEGAGVKQDLVEAYAWFAVASAQGVDEATAIMEHVYTKLDEAEREQARALAEQYIEHYSAP